MATLLDPDAIDLDYAPKLREHVAKVPIENEAILYEEGEGTMHQLNPTAAAVTTLFDGEVTLKTLVDDLVAVFEGDRETIEHDVLSMTRDLARKGLLEGVRGEGEDDPAEEPPAARSEAPPGGTSGT